MGNMVQSHAIKAKKKKLNRQDSAELEATDANQKMKKKHQDHTSKKKPKIRLTKMTRAHAIKEKQKTQKTKRIAELPLSKGDADAAETKLTGEENSELVESGTMTNLSREEEGDDDTGLVEIVTRVENEELVATVD